jgi:hypothetical protein
LLIHFRVRAGAHAIGSAENLKEVEHVVAKIALVMTHRATPSIRKLLASNSMMLLISSQCKTYDPPEWSP